MILANGCNITKSEKFKGVWILSVPTVSEDFSEDACWEDVYAPQLYSFNGLSKGSWKSQRQSLQYDSRHTPVSLHAFNTWIAHVDRDWWLALRAPRAAWVTATCQTALAADSHWLNADFLLSCQEAIQWSRVSATPVWSPHTTATISTACCHAFNSAF